MNENEICYRILKDFQEEADITVDTLAQAARMEPPVLKTCFDTASKPSIGTFASLASGMLKIMDDFSEETRAGLHPHYVRFVEEYIRINPDQFEQQSNPYFSKALVGLAEKTGRDDLKYLVAFLLGLESEMPHPQPGQNNDDFSRIGEVWNTLNASGRHIAFRLLRELAALPEFRRQ